MAIKNGDLTIDNVVLNALNIGANNLPLDVVTINGTEVYRRKYKVTLVADSYISNTFNQILYVSYNSVIEVVSSNNILIKNPIDGTIEYNLFANPIDNDEEYSYGFERFEGIENTVTKDLTIAAYGKIVASNYAKIFFTAENGIISHDMISVKSGSTYTLTENQLTINNNGENIIITFLPSSTDSYYEYGSIASWTNLSNSGTLSGTIYSTVSVTKVEKTYTCDLSWGQNNPEVNPEEIGGWDNGGNVYGVSLLADHTYVLHREDSAGISVSYLGLVNADGSHTIIEPYTVNTDVIYIGVSCFYFGDVVNDKEPTTKYCEDITEKTTTSINYFFKPGDYIRDNGNQTIKINVHRKQSCCWHTLRDGSWERTKITNSAGKSVTGPSSRTSDDFTWNLDGVVANRPVYMYIGFGSSVSTTTTGHATDSKPWDWIGDGGCSWTITGESTGKIHTHYNSGTRATLLYTWWRWVFQRLY